MMDAGQPPDEIEAAMHPTEPKSLSDYFKEGMQCRHDGKSLRDNPYSAGSEKRREWNAGFCATVAENEDAVIEEDDDDRHVPED
ncbi:MAG: hypothetical protein ACRYGP_17895 [Janthinobacterium lividum]